LWPDERSSSPAAAAGAAPGSVDFDFALRWQELSLAHAAEVERLAEVHRQEREILRQEQGDIYQNENHKFNATRPRRDPSDLASALKDAYETAEEGAGTEKAEEADEERISPGPS